MPDAAIRATERQFLALLEDTAPDGVDVTLRLYMLPEMPRAEATRELFLSTYDPIDALYEAGADALIVTGAEPRMPELKQEPYWQALTGLVDWAQDNTISSIWSCLAAHAAVLHLDGINRRPLDGKLSGVFDCVKAHDHALMAGAPPLWQVPHSRHNDLRPDELEAGGYSALTRSPIAGVDTFIKQRNSLFLFFQGHLEYESRSLLREYVRDITRYMDGERDTYPEVPHGYFSGEAEKAFSEVRDVALAKRNAKPLAAAAAHAAEQHLANPWRLPAANIYRNWLDYLWQRKLRQLPQAQGTRVAGGIYDQVT